jgi:hypothetical protein
MFAIPQRKIDHVPSMLMTATNGSKTVSADAIPAHDGAEARKTPLLHSQLHLTPMT